MEGKKKFEKPVLEVVEMKLRPLAAGSPCPTKCNDCECDICPWDCGGD